MVDSTVQVVSEVNRIRSEVNGFLHKYDRFLQESYQSAKNFEDETLAAAVGKLVRDKSQIEHELLSSLDDALVAAGRLNDAASMVRF
jgi:hypothetical protein